MELLAAKSKFLICLIHSDVAASGYTAGSHATGNNGCVGGHTTADGQDTLSNLHTGNILGRGLQTNQNNLLASCSPLLCVLSREYNLTAGSARRCSKSLAKRGSRLQRSCVKLGMKQCIQVSRIDHCNGFFLGSHALIHQIAGDLQCSLSGSLSVTGLQHVEFLVFNSKLHILHISVMVLQCLANFLKLSKCLRELLSHLRDRHRGADTCNHVLALSVDQELAHQLLLAGSRVSGKRNTGSAVIAHVTECHGLYVYSGTPGIRDIVVAAVYVRARVVPGTEYGLDGSHQLLLGIIREILSDLSLVLCLELRSQLLQIISGQLYVVGHALLGFHLVDELLEVLLADFHNDIGVHLDKSPIAVPCPTGISGFLCDNIYNVLIQTQVQDRVHHTGHGSSCSGTNGNQQRILQIAEFLSGNLFHLADVLVDLLLNLLVDLSAVLIVLSTCFCGNGKSLRHRKTKAGHLCQVCTLAAKKLSHVCVTFGKKVNPFSCHCNFLLIIYTLFCTDSIPPNKNLCKVVCF